MAPPERRDLSLAEAPLTTTEDCALIGQLWNNGLLELLTVGTIVIKKSGSTLEQQLEKNQLKCEADQKGICPLEQPDKQLCRDWNRDKDGATTGVTGRRLVPYSYSCYACELPSVSTGNRTPVF
ncbi:hypothetical protein STEG23_024234 [Scotinomys teguina]